MTIVANTFPSFPGIASKPGNTDFHSPSWHRWVGYPCAAKQALLRLVATADVFIQNFRPGVIERLGLDYETARTINPRIVYASITGYGDEGPWRGFPGQDLLAQKRLALFPVR